MKTREDIVNLLRSLIARKVRFRPYGRNPDYGLDCIGIAIWIGWELELVDRERKIPHYSFPPSRDNFDTLDEFLVRTDEIQPGVLLVFSGRDGLPRHISIVSHRRDDGVWKMIGSIPGTLQIGEYGLLPGLSDHIYAQFDYPNVA